MAVEHMARMRRIDPSELLPEEEVLKKDPDHPFLGPADRPEPYRTIFIAHARLQPIFQKEKLQSSPLVVQTPRGLGLVWRWWPSSLGIVLIRQVGDEWAVDDNVTFLSADERKQIKVDLTKVLLNPPKWH